MGIQPETKIVEVLLKIKFRRVPGISDHKVISDYVQFKTRSRNSDKIIMIDEPEFLGVNFGYLQLTPPPVVKTLVKKLTKKKVK